jgi:hypothetical protein
LVAGVLLLVAVVAYLITEAEAKTRRIKLAFDRQALGVRTRRSIADMRALRSESEWTRRDRARLRDQQAEILKSLETIENLLGAELASPGR